MKRLVYGLCGLISFVMAAVVIFTASDRLAEEKMRPLFPHLTEAAFTLTDTNGTSVSNLDLIGSPKLVFFGFTHCPEVCPLTLNTLSYLLDDIGAAADEVDIVFISVDPERDTPALMREYLAGFDDNTIGLTGRKAAVAKVIQHYRVYVEKVPHDQGDYQINHTASVFLFDAQGRFSGLISWGEDELISHAKIENLLAG